MFHVKQKRVAFRSPAGGVSGWSPADLAVCLLFCPHPPDPLPPWGRGRFLVYFAGGWRPRPPAAKPGRHWLNRGGWRPRHPLRLSLRGTGLPGGSAPCIPGAEPGRHWLFSAMSVFFSPIPRPPSRREGGDFWFSYARGSAPCIPGAEPGRH